MAALLPLVNTGATAFVVVGQVATIVVAAALLGERLRLAGSFCQPVLELARRYGRALVFLVASAGVATSLFYSNVIGYAPCVLCWWQRIFLYPIAIVSGLALVKRDRAAGDYLLALALLGGLVAGYHVALDRGALTSAPCAVEVVSCTVRYVSELNGYVTIPMMSLTAFGMMTVLPLAGRHVRVREGR